MRLRDLTRPGQYLLILAMGLVAYWAITLWARYPAARALPEYATRTGEPCATCHVKAGSKDLNDAGKYYGEHKKLPEKK